MAGRYAMLSRDPYSNQIKAPTADEKGDRFKQSIGRMENKLTRRARNVIQQVLVGIEWNHGIQT